MDKPRREVVILGIFCISLLGLVSSTSYCVDTPYKMEDSICCGNKLHPRGVTLRCCQDTGDVYDAATQVCCGKVHNVERPWSVDCCRKGSKTTLFNTSSQACCHGNIHSTKRQIELWNGKTYEGDIAGFCCGENFVDTTYDEGPGYMACCSRYDYPAFSMSYNTSQSVCCADRVQPRTKSGQCCGRHTYDPTEEKCCYPNGTAIVLRAIGNGRSQCCAKAPGGVISLATHVCIDDEPRERECHPQAYNPTAPRTQGCCSYLSYNKTTHHCCAARVLPHGTECCAGQPVLEGQVCCGPDHGAVTVSNPGDNACCYRPASWQTYDNSTHKCHYGVVKRRVLCGGKTYNPANKSCCDGVLSDTGCCAGRPVLEGQVCCGPDHGAVTVSNPGDNVCCYTASSHNTYDNSTHTCRHGVVRQRSMCGRKQFNPAKKMCCDGELYQHRNGYQCCGNKIYTPKYLTCCNGKRIQGAKRPCQ